jgi:hypothetical protein
MIAFTKFCIGAKPVGRCGLKVKPLGGFAPGRGLEPVRQMDAAWLVWWKECTGKAWTGTAPKERGDE